MLTQEVQKWFLTYPKCDWTHQQVLDALQALDLAATIKDYVVARELHKDGTPHFHVYLSYDRKVSWAARRWDLAPDVHGCYEPCKNWQAVARYCHKDGDYISNFDLNAAAAKKATGRAERNTALLEGDLTVLGREGHFDLKDYLRLKANKEAFLRDELPLLPLCSGFIPNNLGHVLEVFPLGTKRRNYWFWSRGPNTGKTTFLKSVASAYPSYWMGYSETFQSPSPHTQFLLLDEYSVPHLKTTQLNQICDGTYPFPTKGGNPVTLKNPILLVGSNKPPEEVYPNDHPLIKARFFVIEL